MKMIFVLMMSMFMLMLLPLPLQAKDVYLALVSEDLTKGLKNLDSLDVIIMANDQNIDQYFKNGNLTLQPNQELIIRGGRGSIKRELDQYKRRNVILNTGGQNWVTLSAYFCYVKRPIGRENTTYVMLRTAYKWEGENYCTKTLYPDNASDTVINLGSLGAAVKAKKE
jgi:hypothetical protein